MSKSPEEKELLTLINSENSQLWDQINIEQLRLNRDWFQISLQYEINDQAKLDQVFKIMFP